MDACRSNEETISSLRIFLEILRKQALGRPRRTEDGSYRDSSRVLEN